MALGIDWLPASPPGNAWQGVSNDGAVTVAVASTGSGNRVAYSLDNGITWTAGVSAADQSWQAVEAGGGVWIKVSSNGVLRIAKSVDGGATWAFRTTPSSVQQFNCISYGNNVWVIGASGGARLFRSTDGGDTWVAVELSGSFAGQAMANDGAGNVCYVGPDAQMCLFSLDGGLTFNAASNLGGGGLPLYAVIWDGSQFVAVGDNCVATSPTGDIWTQHTIPAGSYRGVAFAQGVYSAVGLSNLVSRSEDAETWDPETDIPGAGSHDWRAITPTSGGFSALASAFITDPLAMYSVGSACTILGEAARYRSEGETTTGTRLLTDDEYRLFIKARIAKNQSKGNINNLVDLILFIVGSGGFILFDGPGPAEFTVGFNVGTLSANDKVFISQSDLLPKPAGVGLNLFEYPASGAFGYVGAPGDIAGYDVGQYIETF